MRRMYSKEQIKSLIDKELSNIKIEEDLSDIVLTKGAPTNDVSIKMVRVGHCTTITGYVRIVNLNPDPTEVIAFTCNNLFSDLVDGDEIVLNQSNESGNSFASGYISVSGTTSALIIRAIPTGINTYYIDADIIDNTPLPVEA